jgi:hypothetical protein
VAQRSGHLERPVPAPRFAQTVGMAVSWVALGLDPAAEIGAGLAFVAAVLNASVDFCLGCRLYLLLARVRSRTA